MPLSSDLTGTFAGPFTDIICFLKEIIVFLDNTLRVKTEDYVFRKGFLTR